MATPLQIAANQHNAARSTGPRTPEGKARSSRNALKHGLTSKDVVLPNEDPAAYQDQLDQWVGYYRPEDPAQLATIERAVTSKWKLDRCTRLETERLSEKVRHAADRYDLERLTEVETIGRQLIFEPMCRTDPPAVHDPVFRERLAQRTAANPAILSKTLQTTAQGTQWLIDRWCELGHMLELHGFWHYPEKFRALWMLGRRPEDVLEDKAVQHMFLACNIAHPDTDDNDPDRFDLWDECYQAKMGLEGKPMYFFQIDALRPRRPADHLTARALLWEILTKELTRLRELKANHLDPLDRADRASAQERAMFDGSKEGVLLRRYETACEREFHKSIADLMKLRKDAPPVDRPLATACADVLTPETTPPAAQMPDVAAETASAPDVASQPRAHRSAPRNEPDFDPSTDPRPSKTGPSHAGPTPGTD